MTPPLAHPPAAAAPAGPGPVASFLRFAVLGGGAGVLCGLTVPLPAAAVPWAVANAVVTVASALLCTELHARFTCAEGRGARRREHWRSAGPATAAYLATSVAVRVLYLLRPSPGPLTEQLVHLGASGLAGTGRFPVLRRCVFAPAAAGPYGRRFRTSGRAPVRRRRERQEEDCPTGSGGGEGRLRGERKVRRQPGGVMPTRRTKGWRRSSTVPKPVRPAITVIGSSAASRRRRAGRMRCAVTRCGARSARVPPLRPEPSG
ncbi:hypothetical protein ACIBAI_22085 [Streptomyces sp. NPDC051041]|uniref:hypothetical protein n=1 Tax=Streptomyces sp. NPDC051041 TaxID=3365640 RepID=UPI0037A1711C